MNNTSSTMKKGFTLIELLVVISIISLLSSIILASLQSSREKAQASKLVSELRELKRGLEMYRIDNGAYFAMPTIDPYMRGWTPAQYAYFKTALAPYINTDKITIISNLASSFHYVDGPRAAMYGVGLSVCGGVTVRTDGYIIGFYSTNVDSAFKKWAAYGTFNCFLNE